MKRQTKQRCVVREIFDVTGRPLAPHEVLEKARVKAPSISVATIYRTLRSLSEDGVIVPVSIPGESDRYESRQCADNHHHHFHCDDCGRVFDIPGCGLHSDTRLPAGFLVNRHEVVLYGACHDCSTTK